MQWRAFVSTPMVQKDQSVLLLPGMSARAFSRSLKQDGVIKYPLLFEVLLRFDGNAHRLQAGEYVLTPDITPPELVAMMVAGRVNQHAFLMVEGWTFRNVRKALNDAPKLLHATKAMTDAQIMTALGEPKKNPEGLFFPNTYQYVYGDSDLSVLKRARDRMKGILADEWKTRLPGLSYRSPYQALIVASMIEKETAIEAERTLIAAVILKRLKKWMRLQIDPTVVYGLGKPYGYRLTRADLAKKTPYNTYRRYGLPPTPIDMPGLASIKAALHPVKTDALYYVAKPDGSHVFSKTYAAHKRAISKWLK